MEQTLKNIIYRSIAGDSPDKLVQLKSKLSDGVILPGTPLIIREADLIHDSNTIVISSYFPTLTLNEGLKECLNGWVFERRKLLLDSKTKINHLFKTVEVFDLNKLDRIYDYVHNVGPISFVINDVESIIHLFNNIKTIRRNFKYTSYICNASNKYTEATVFLIEFVANKDCYAIFNRRRSDGFTCILKTLNLSNNKILGSLTINIVFSNFKDNLFTIDGSTFLKIQSLSDSYPNAMVSAIINNKTNSRKDSSKSKDKPEKSYIIATQI